MTHKINKSALVEPKYTMDLAFEGFSRVVQLHINELQHWNDHMIKVRAYDDTPEPVKPMWEDYKESKDPAADYMRDMARYTAETTTRPMPYPAPEAPADVAASVKTVVAEDGRITFVPDFEIVNDDPTPEEILLQKKAQLMEMVSIMESSAIEKLMPPIGKRRLIGMRETDIYAADAKRIKEALDELPKDTPREQAEQAVKEATEARSADDAKFIAEQVAMRESIATIQRKAAKALAEIEDLTLDTVDKFELPKFD